ncbi:MAG: alpha/beta hydrolase [Pseudomonadales bacterium]
MTTAPFVAEYGVGQPDSVIWLHGALVGGWMWDEQIAALPDYHHLVPDLPGIGLSAEAVSAGEAGDLDAMAAALVDLCRERCGDRRVHLVGLSLGAVIGLRMLSQAPERFDRAILSGPLAKPLKGPIAALQELVLFLYQRPWGARLVARILGLPDDVRDAFLATAAATPAETYAGLMPEVYRAPLPGADLSAIPNPVLLVTGDRDSRITRDSVRLLLQRLANAQGYWADGLGHQWNAEDGERFSAMVAAWLTGQPQPPGLSAIARDQTAARGP